jgi:hypothetical protein
VAGNVTPMLKVVGEVSGAGVNARVSDTFGIRVGADYRRILTGGHAKAQRLTSRI